VSADLRILLTADAIGGVWQYSTDLARGLSKLGIETVLAVLGPSPSPDQAKAVKAFQGVTLVDTGLPLDWLAASPASVALAGNAIGQLAARHDVDLIQLHSAALAAEADFDRPVVAVAHSCVPTWWAAVKGTPIDQDYRWRAELTTRGLRAVDKVVAPTTAFARETQAAHGLETLPATVHNGRAPLPVPTLAPHDFAFTAGRLWDRGKNLSTLDKAAAALPFPLHAAGPVESPHGDSIALENINAVGLLCDKQIGRWLAARPVFVSTALYEPFGLAVLEAAAAGCPLVLSDIRTFRELWGGVAAFVDPLDADAFAETMRLVVEDDFARAEMGRQAEARASCFTVEAMAGKMAALYAELTGKTTAAARCATVAA
jgi:glycosyltransferase involved in cell wall biosynthesis